MSEPWNVWVHCECNFCVGGYEPGQEYVCGRCGRVFRTSDRPLSRSFCMALRFDGDLCGSPDIVAPAPQPLCLTHLRKLEEFFQYRFEEEQKWLRKQEIQAREESDPERAQGIGHVYYIQVASGMIKIGFTQNLEKRVQSFRSNHGEVTLLATEKGTRETEALRHTRFGPHRQYGEWFSPTPELLEHIAEVTGRGVAWDSTDGPVESSADVPVDRRPGT
jgi:Meiotically up-regulated gene 113